MKQFNFIFLIALFSKMNCPMIHASEKEDDNIIICSARKTSSPIPPAPETLKRSHKTFNFSENSSFEIASKSKKITTSSIQSLAEATSKLTIKHPNDYKAVDKNNTDNSTWLAMKIQSNSRPPIGNKDNKISPSSSKAVSKNCAYNQSQQTKESFTCDSPEFESQDC